MIDKILGKYDVILASGSPRRQELFRLLGINARIVPADIEEPFLDISPLELAITHASNKASEISRHFPQSLVVGADTLVAVQDKVLGKPLDQAQARQYLNMLSGRQHEVFTGICIRMGERTLQGGECTEVLFKELTPGEIESYLETGEPMDKAGAYGIQGYGAQFIKAVYGCYFNVMGFPIHRFYSMLQAWEEALYAPAY